MDEITLTGGTLLDDKKNKNNTTSGHNGLFTNQELQRQQQIEMMSTKPHRESSQQQNHHNHSHSHGNSHGHSHDHDGGGGGGKACCGPHVPARPQVSLQMPAEELVKQEPAKVIQALFLVTRMGDYELFEKIMNAWKNDMLSGSSADSTQQWKDILKQIFQENGVVDGSFADANHTILHWACKRKDEPRFCHFWAEYINVFIKTTDGTGMTALHWACTEGPNLPIIRFLIEEGRKQPEQPSLLEQVDASGCTPLLIAAQYGQVEAVAYVIQKGANRHALDTNRDSALHWAAYKGNASVLGLILYYESEDHQKQITAPDVYGQTPLHLAALRGNKSVCRYLLDYLASVEGRIHVRRLLHTEDKNGRTPEGLARHKERVAVAAFLNDYTLNYVEIQRAKGITREIAAFVRNLRSVHRWRVCLGIASADDDMDEAPHVPFYYTALQVVGNVVFYFTVLMPIFGTKDDVGILFDYALMHLWNICLIIAIVTFWVRTWKTDPGRLVKNSEMGPSSVPPAELQYWRKLYEDTLEAYADESRHDSLQSIQLCHTCHLAKPPRSKHDRYSRSCVLSFDHMCPFTGNAIGLYNYKWFYLFLVTMTLFFVDMWWLMIVYWRRADKVSLVVALIGIYLASHIFMTGGLLIYHTQLVLTNLTTNEHINVTRYEHFWTKDSQGQRKYRNPWFQGYWNNVLDRFFPTQASYRLPDQQEGLLPQRRSHDQFDKIDRVV